MIEEWKGSKQEKFEKEDEADEEDLYIKEIKIKDEEEALKEAMEAGKEGRFTAHVKVPTQKDIEEALLRRKKQELLEMLAIDSGDLDQLEKESKVEQTLLKSKVDPKLTGTESMDVDTISENSSSDVKPDDAVINE